jgi:hypothetical protein
MKVMALSSIVIIKRGGDGKGLQGMWDPPREAARELETVLKMFQAMCGTKRRSPRGSP